MSDPTLDTERAQIDVLIQDKKDQIETLEALKNDLEKEYSSESENVDDTSEPTVTDEEQVLRDAADEAEKAREEAEAKTIAEKEAVAKEEAELAEAEAAKKAEEEKAAAEAESKEKASKDKKESTKKS